MQTFPTSKFLLLLNALAALSACGGGGGGDPPSQPAVNLAVPTGAETGLAAPTRTVKREQHLGLPLVNEVLVSYNRAAGAAALKAAGRLAPGLAQAGPSPMVCAGGGGISWTNDPATGLYAYSYNACQDSGYTFTGNSTASAAAAGGWQQSYSALQAGTLATPLALADTVSCSSPASPGAASRCLVSHRAYGWGFDARFEGGRAYGTHRVDGDSAWNVTFTDYTTTAGAAMVSASNGTAVVTHGNTDKDFVVSVTIDGVTSTYSVACPQAPEACPSPF